MENGGDNGYSMRDMYLQAWIQYPAHAPTTPFKIAVLVKGYFVVMRQHLKALSGNSMQIACVRRYLHPHDILTRGREYRENGQRYLHPLYENFTPL